MKVSVAINRPCFINASCNLGETITDSGCQLSGRKCGINMEFIPFPLKLPVNICIQHCQCDNESFASNGEQCIRRNSLSGNSLEISINETKIREKRVSLSSAFFK